MKKSHLWSIEITVWFLVIILAGIGIHHKITEKNRYYAKSYVQLEDTYGLIVGSPVKYMGVQVGYITKLKMKDSKILVEFVLTRRDLKLVAGTVVSVEFSGLAASKSLELSPPVVGELNSRSIVAVQPYRIKNYLENQKNIATNIIEMSGNIGNFFEGSVVNKYTTELKSQRVYKITDSILNKVIDVETDLIENHNKLMEQKRKDGK